VFRWVQRFTLLLADAARLCRRSPGDRWFADETYVKVNGVWRYVYGQWTSTARSLMSWSAPGAMARRRGSSSSARWRR
jgi:transposase-like protein